MVITELQKELTDLIASRNSFKSVAATLSRKRDTDLVLSLKKHTSNLPISSTLAQRVYHIVSGLVDLPTCTGCDNTVTFINFRLGYRSYCSARCSTSAPETQEKMKKTCLAKYGVTNGRKSLEFQEKYKKTCLAKYGVDNPSKSLEVMEKKKKTCLGNYGVANPAQSPEVREKMINSLYTNSTGACSKQQKYIHNLIGGELNYPVGGCMLDIAFPECKVYFEYDGGGHNLSVKLGSTTEDVFINKERKRNHFLLGRGWKRIRLVSRKDSLPTNSILTSIVAKARTVLQERSWVAFDIDKSEIQTSQYKTNFDFGELQKVR